MSALFIHLGLGRPPSTGSAAAKGEKVLIWGVSSSFGTSAAQIAQHAGYDVVGVAAGRHAALAKSFSLAHFVDRSSPNVVKDLVALGPFKAVFAGADSAEDQVKMGQVLAAGGGGRILSAAGIDPGVEFPPGVSGFFQQYLDDFLDPNKKEFVEWVWWDYLEAAFAEGRFKSVPLEVKQGLAQVTEAWDLLRRHQVGGKRLIIVPESD
jgi:NADPH:quinone reductase-like Zn-dependent oxidoreductase